MEVFWLVTFMVTSVLVAYIQSQKVDYDYVLISMPFIALAMYLFRRFSRLKNPE